jgi:hypothetical protein
MLGLLVLLNGVIVMQAIKDGGWAVIGTIIFLAPIANVAFIFIAALFAAFIRLITGKQEPHFLFAAIVAPLCAIVVDAMILFVVPTSGGC